MYKNNFLFLCIISSLIFFLSFISIFHYYKSINNNLIILSLNKVTNNFNFSFNSNNLNQRRLFLDSCWMDNEFFINSDKLDFVYKAR
jgi:hypothetical protein